MPVRHVEISCGFAQPTPTLKQLPLKSGKSKFNSSFLTIRTLIRQCVLLDAIDAAVMQPEPLLPRVKALTGLSDRALCRIGWKITSYSPGIYQRPAGRITPSPSLRKARYRRGQ